MLEKILNLQGAETLVVSEQKNIKGGSIPPDGQCNEFVVFRATEAQCLAYPYNLRPAYIGPNQCSILMAPC
ncbi:hypothetical protein NJT12_22545 [Flavobacterium sp. AC]|uniref:Uncharacterized protein n=1 Tax=Flavobacterium azizsancarii TaxID=2961580 RepID=A0ABT4WIJ1_9FLAO|nr:hypothetical protein [Flavobacterium azizsancarii]MDA6072409.1 hypothetical protein [Flavobacterium azizsancarii]